MIMLVLIIFKKAKTYIIPSQMLSFIFPPNKGSKLTILMLNYLQVLQFKNPKSVFVYNKIILPCHHLRSDLKAFVNGLLGQT